jgi:hypothetical protein
MYEMEGPRLASRRSGGPIARPPSTAGPPPVLATRWNLPVSRLFRVPGVSPEPVPASSGEVVLLRGDQRAQGLQDTNFMIL